jgi:hypothetical protein
MLRLAEGPSLRGVLSTLRVDGRVIAIHFGLQSDEVLRSWLAVHDPEQPPGFATQVLLLQIAEQAAVNGVQRIELGKGVRKHTGMFATDAVEVAAGYFDRRPFATAIRRGWSATRDWVSKSSLRETAWLPARLVQPIRAWLANDSRPWESARTQRDLPAS